MYSYDVAPTIRPSSGRTIPGMRPAYDADRPVSPTPIYDALYSEYRRLFRALPGDRTDEDQLRFAGFSSFAPYSGFASPSGAAYPQHQAFETFAGHAHGTPQFISGGRAGTDTRSSETRGTEAEGQVRPSASSEHRQGRTAAGLSVAGTGQGWVAAGYLGSGRPAVGADSTAAAHLTGVTAADMTAVGAGAVTGGGKHRSVLALPSRRSPEQL